MYREKNQQNDLDGFLVTCLQSNDVVFQKTALFLMKILIEVKEDMKNTKQFIHERDQNILLSEK